MSSAKASEILGRIIQTALGSIAVEGRDLLKKLDSSGRRKVSLAIQDELGVTLTENDIESAESLLMLSDLVESRLGKDPSGRSLVKIYAVLEDFVREELSHDINYQWYAVWVGDLLHNTDSLDDVEIVLRIEDAFGFSISDRDVQEMKTVGQTVRYLWRRSCEQNFKLRQRSVGVCQSTFIFHELRRLLMVRGGLPRSAVRLDERLGELTAELVSSILERSSGNLSCGPTRR